MVIGIGSMAALISLASNAEILGLTALICAAVSLYVLQRGTTMGRS
jgi:hypothetical protein